MMEKILHLFISLSFCFAFVYNGFSQQINKNIPSDLCIDDDAWGLYEAINTYRQKLSLDPIPLSASLCYLAQLHVKDLSDNFDMKHAWKSDCGMKSWSDKGHWKAFCYPTDQSNKRDIKDKAKELTPYKGKAWELLYWENEWAPLADKVLKLWLEIQPSADLISNTGKHKNKIWESIGVAYRDGYISVFLGVIKDTQGKVKRCGATHITTDEIANSTATDNSTQEVPNAGTAQDPAMTQCHIIVASFNNKADAQNTVKDYVQKGYTNACIISGAANSFRVSLGAYPSAEKAAKDLRKIQKQQKDAWILRL